MVVGLDKFKSYFKDFQDNYLIIGGTACDIVFEEAALKPRATKDIDIILIFEALSADFVAQFWNFVKAAQYTRCEKETEKRNAYRFVNPKDKDFPHQVELFCRTPDSIEFAEMPYLSPIPTEEGLSSLSAILLNDDYYHYTLQNSDVKDGIHFALPQSLICLKAYAYLSNKKLKESGKNIRQENIEKHKKDVLRLILLIPENTVFEIPEGIKKDLQEFANTIKSDLPNADIFKIQGIGKQSTEEIFKQFLKAFNL